MQKKISASTPGKLILLGEHTVVYGKPALIRSIDKHCTITITEKDDANIEIISQTFATTKVLSQQQITEKTQHAQQQWEAFAKTNDPAILTAITKDPMDYPIICIGETLHYYQRSIPTGFTLTIASEIPVGSGMGSSAALAVAIAKALTQFLDKACDKEAIIEIAFRAEQKKHGFPSGADIHACFLGGLVWYRRETPDLKIMQQVPFVLPAEVSNNFSTIFTGIPEETTGEMVSWVRSQFSNPTSQKAVQAIFDDQEQLTRDFLTALKEANHEEIIRIIRAGEQNLEKLGVVSEYVKDIIRKIETEGGAAKICGGGGRTKGTGTVLRYNRRFTYVR